MAEPKKKIKDIFLLTTKNVLLLESHLDSIFSLLLLPVLETFKKSNSNLKLNFREGLFCIEILFSLQKKSCSLSLLSTPRFGSWFHFRRKRRIVLLLSKFHYGRIFQFKISFTTHFILSKFKTGQLKKGLFKIGALESVPFCEIRIHNKLFKASSHQPAWDKAG